MAARQARFGRPVVSAGAGGVRPVTHVLLGAACGALAVCGVQLVLVLLSEMELNRSVATISE